VGWVLFQPDNVLDCFPTATFWESPSDIDPVDLAQYLTVPYHQSRAFAINSLANPQVVGRNEETSHAILWEYASGWSSRDLNRSDSPPNYIISDCADAQWQITEAHDINDDGWIVALGTTFVQSTLELHALLLTPVGDCPYDVDVDGDIDEEDSVAIYRFMVHNPVVSGACGPGIICIWDVNFDCIVDGDDMEAVLDWIAECEADPCLCEGGESFGGGGGLSAERFAAALDACDPALTGPQLAQAWVHFFSALD
jgi:hypothetical protein